MVIARGETGGRAGPQKVVGSIPNLVGFSSRTMVLGSTQPLTDISTRNLPGVKGGLHVQLITLTPRVRQLTRKCSLDVSQPHRPPWPD
jgi:hypothetical protein